MVVMSIPRKTKIICTIGPSTHGLENLIKLIESGMDAARLNFSHGTHSEHKKIIEDIRQASQETGRHVAILQDLQGPKIRTCKVKNNSVLLEDGQKFTITINPIEIGDSRIVSTEYANLVKEVKPGNTILIDDGYINLLVEDVTSTDIITKVVKGGKLKNNKGIIAPGVSSQAPSLSEKDFEDLKFGLAHDIDAVALSFVRSEKDIIELKTAMKIFGRSVPIIAKIERYEGYEDIEDIVEESDGIMVARGDLGLEMPAEQVPVLQKEIIERCNYHGKPVITATQMLESMINHPRPTRAEASDVANAVLDGTDCVMLSGETSVGKYPFDAVDFMQRIIKNVETRYIMKRPKHELSSKESNKIDDALGKASCVIAEQINAAAIISLTSSGYTASNIAKYRPRIPIVAITENEETLRQLSFIRGVYAILMNEEKDPENVFKQLGDFVKNLDYISEGDNVVFVSGLTQNKVNLQNAIKVYQV